MSVEAAGASPLALGWTAEKCDAARASATWLQHNVAGICANLDAAHEAGLFIPAKATEAVAALQALGRSWLANSVGVPAEAGDKHTLGIG